jgi:hypothetical protein
LVTADNPALHPSFSCPKLARNTKTGLTTKDTKHTK